ncbi:hypothetical protein Tco_0090568 [Tanacetum coccineum]
MVSNTPERGMMTLQLPGINDSPKHGMTSCDSIGTPMATKHLDADLSGTLVDQTKYRSMVGALMYLTEVDTAIVHEHVIVRAIKQKPTEKTSHCGGDMLVSGHPKSRTALHVFSRSEYVYLSACCAQCSRNRIQLADLFTKALSVDRFCLLSDNRYSYSAATQFGGVTARLRTSMVDFRGNWNTHFREMSFSLRWGLSFEYGCASFKAWYGKELLMPRVVKSRDEIFSRWGYCDNHDLSRLDNQSIERDRLIGIGFVLNFVKFISFTFGDKEMISVIEAVSR